MISKIVSVLAISLAIAFAPVPTSARDTPLGGSTWRALDKETKTVYVLGFVRGYQAGAQQQHFSHRIELCGVLPDPNSVDEAERGRKFMAHMECLNEPRRADSNQMKASDVGLLVAGLDELYSDYANLNIDIIQALVHVQNRISGRISDEQFTRHVEFLRTIGLNPLPD